MRETGGMVGVTTVQDRSAETGSQQRRLDMAARAAWLYFIGGNTQDEIAAKLGVSRPAAQRLVALAVAETLIRFRPDHQIAGCMELAEALIDRKSVVLGTRVAVRVDSGGCSINKKKK